MPDGSEPILRFTIVHRAENEQDVVMEISADGGETWTQRTRQFMRRVE